MCERLGKHWFGVLFINPKHIIINTTACRDLKRKFLHLWTSRTKLFHFPISVSFLSSSHPSFPFLSLSPFPPFPHLPSLITLHLISSSHHFRPIPLPNSSLSHPTVVPLISRLFLFLLHFPHLLILKHLFVLLRVFASLVLLLSVFLKFSQCYSFLCHLFSFRH